MPSPEALARQIEALSEEFAGRLGEEYQKFTAEMQARIDALSGELEQARTLEQAALAARQGVEHDLEKSRKRVASLAQSLKEARQATAAAKEWDTERDRLLQQVAMLQHDCAQAQAALEQERSIRKRLEKGAAADERRLDELETALAAATAGVPMAGAAEDGQCEGEELQQGLRQALADLEEERAARQGLEQALEQSDQMIAALEKALKSSRHTASPGVEQPAEHPLQQDALAAQLAGAQAQLQAEQQECRKLSEAYDQAVARIAELERDRRDGGAAGLPSAAAGMPAGTGPAKGKPLPHEVRPAPRAGARFHPDWELHGLPCQADQVVLAWGSVSNVQLSLEGYPAQYCAAFLVVAKQGRQKRLYMLFDLKSSKHTLICVPDKPPGDEAALSRLIGEGRKYLLISGFELEEIVADEVPGLLGRYLSKA